MEIIKIWPCIIMLTYCSALFASVEVFICGWRVSLYCCSVGVAGLVSQGTVHVQYTLIVT